MIDGNHRLAAIRLLEKEPNSCAPAVSNVDVHAGISKDTEKHIALSEPIVVKSCVSLCFKIYLFVVCASHSLQEYYYIVPVHAGQSCARCSCGVKKIKITRASTCLGAKQVSLRLTNEHNIRHSSSVI